MTTYRSRLRRNVAAIDRDDVWAAGLLDLLHTAIRFLPDEAMRTLVAAADNAVSREARLRDRRGDRAGHDRLCRLLNLLDDAHLSATEHTDE